MPVVIRMARAGTKKRPFYHVVVADSQSTHAAPTLHDRLRDLRPDRAFGQRRIEGRDAANGRAQAVNATGISGVTNRAGDIGTMRDMADARGDRRSRAAG